MSVPASQPPPPAAAPSVPSAPAPAVSAVRCENCGNEVTQRYCGACGQRLEPPVHSLWHFSQVAFEDITHADSRLWRTLSALLFRPGLLTREFLAGHRARYLPPFRLYLVLSVLFFLVAGIDRSQVEVVKWDESKSPAAAIKGAKVYDVREPDRPGESHEQHIERECSGWNYSGPFQAQLAPRLPQACRHILADNGQSLLEAFLHNVPRAMFFFLPLLAGIMALMYWRPRHYYVEHLLLFVHNHAFVFLAGAVLLLLSDLAPHIPFLRGVLFFYFVWYMYRSMRVVYGQGRALTISKLVLLALFYLVFATAMFGITVAYSALTL